MRFPPYSTSETIMAFESLCLRFRPVYADGDATRFSNVHSQLGRLLVEGSTDRADPVFEWLEFMGRMRAFLLNHWVMLAPGNLTPSQAINLAFDGELFHLNDSKNEELEWGGRDSIFSALFQQISVFSELCTSLALGVEALLAETSLLPWRLLVRGTRFDPRLSDRLDPPRAITPELLERLSMTRESSAGQSRASERAS
jgi:hypothetical protein